MHYEDRCRERRVGVPRKNYRNPVLGPESMGVYEFIDLREYASAHLGVQNNRGGGPAIGISLAHS